MKVQQQLWTLNNWYFQNVVLSPLTPPDGAIDLANGPDFRFHLQCAIPHSGVGASNGIIQCWCKQTFTNPGPAISCNFRLTITNSWNFQSANTGVGFTIDGGPVFSLPAGFIANGVYDFPFTVPATSTHFLEGRFNLQAFNNSNPLNDTQHAGATWAGKFTQL